MIRLLGCTIALLAVAAPPAAAATAGGETVIAVIDTGINAGHRAFDRDQVIGWWDFTKSEPEPGQLVDPARPPFDDDGHGTGTASMAAGRAVQPEQSPSVSPGTKLAIARVFEAGGFVGKVAPAVRWAVDTARADVINISIGSPAPLGPAASTLIYPDDYAELERARRKGVLVVVANGNGVGNTGVTPGDGSTSSYSSSTSVLSVGASGTEGAHHSSQPEVAAAASVVVPVHDGPDGVHTTGGTSFASPFVAGFAAQLVGEIRAAGRRVDAAYVEDLVKFSAEDTAMPPSAEGYGQITAEQLSSALDHARAGTLPERPDPDLNAMYVEEVGGAGRELSDQTPPGEPEPEPEPSPDPGTAPAPAATPTPASQPAPAQPAPARFSALRVRGGVLTFRSTRTLRTTVTLLRGRTVLRRVAVRARRGVTRVRLGRAAGRADRVTLTAPGAKARSVRLARAAR